MVRLVNMPVQEGQENLVWKN